MATKKKPAPREHIPLTPEEERIAARLLGVDDPPAEATAPKTRRPRNAPIPEDEVERLQLFIKDCEVSLHEAIRTGKARNATDLASTRQKLTAQLVEVQREREREDEQASEDNAREEILAFVKALAPEDPLRAELREVLK